MSATRLIALGLMAVGLTASLLPSEAEARCRRARRCCYTTTSCCYNPCATTCCGSVTVSSACNGCPQSRTAHYGTYQEPSMQGGTTQGNPDASGSPSNRTFQAPSAPQPDGNRSSGPSIMEPPPSNSGENRPSN